MRYEVAVVLNENQLRIINQYLSNRDHKERMKLYQVNIHEHLTMDLYIQNGDFPMIYVLLYRKGEVVGDRYIQLNSSDLYPQRFSVDNTEYGGSVDVWICQMSQEGNQSEIISPMEDYFGNRMIVYAQTLPSGKYRISDRGHAYYLASHVWGIPFEKRDDAIEFSVKHHGALYLRNGHECMIVSEAIDFNQNVKNMIRLQHDLAKMLLLKS